MSLAAEAERFIEIWRNWKMEQIVMYCIDGHEREAQSLNLTSLEEIELARIRTTV